MGRGTRVGKREGTRGRGQGGREREMREEGEGDEGGGRGGRGGEGGWRGGLRESWGQGA